MDLLESPLNYQFNGTPPYEYHLYSPPFTRHIHLSGTDSFAPLSTFPADEELHQMHHLRFPTPPTTPPKEAAFLRIRPQRDHNLRTQSVIMRIGQEGGQDSYQVSPQISVLEQSDASSGNNAAIDSDYVCSWINCRRIFESMENLATHVTKVHAVASVVDGLYYCRWEGCPRLDRGFNARYKMLVHVRTHTKEKPHRCHLCHKCFSRAENLKIHIRSHSGEKPYICTFEGCQKAYSNSSDRFKHTRTHSMEKPYVCKVPGCLKRYTDPSSLRKHVKTFKHAEQLIDVKDISQIIPSSTSSSIPEVPRDKQYYSDLIASTIYTEQDCERRNFESCFRMEVDDFKCCYMDKQVEPRNWWQRNSVEKTENYFLEKSTEYNLNLNIELPLDLRKKRIL